MDIRVRLLELMRARPFRPFTLDMSNGRALQVQSPEAFIVGNRVSVHYYIDEEGYDRIVTVQHQNINTIDEYDPVQTP